MLPTDPAAIELLTEGRIDVAGRLVEASNATLYCTIEHDGIAPPSTMERRVEVLRQAGTAVAFHVFKGLGHGFGIGGLRMISRRSSRRRKTWKSGNRSINSGTRSTSQMCTRALHTARLSP